MQVAKLVRHALPRQRPTVLSTSLDHSSPTGGMRGAFCGAVRAKRGRATTERVPALPFRSSDPVRCAEAIIDRAGRDIALAMPIGIGKPVPLVNALYRLAEADRSLRLRIFTGLTLVRPALSHAAWSGASSSRCSTACSAPTPISPTSRRCAAAACRPTSRSPSSSCRPAPGSATPACSRATPASTTRRWPRTWSASAPTSSPSWWRRTRRASRASASAPTPTSRSTCAPYIAARRQAGQPLALAVEINANLPYMPGEAEIDLSECRRRAGDRAPRTTTCSRRPRSRCRSPTTPWRCTRPRSSRTAARCRSASARSRTRWRMR